VLLLSEEPSVDGESSKKQYHFEVRTAVDITRLWFSLWPHEAKCLADHFNTLTLDGPNCSASPVTNIYDVAKPGGSCGLNGTRGSAPVCDPTYSFIV